MFDIGKDLKEAYEQGYQDRDKEIVRCKDCEYGEVDDNGFPNQYLCHHNGSDWNDGEHFCSYGKRKGGAE